MANQPAPAPAAKKAPEPVKGAPAAAPNTPPTQAKTMEQPTNGQAATEKPAAAAADKPKFTKEDKKAAIEAVYATQPTIDKLTAELAAAEAKKFKAIEHLREVVGKNQFPYQGMIVSIRKRTFTTENDEGVKSEQTRWYLDRANVGDDFS